MAESDSNKIERALDFFILKTLSDGPLQSSDLERRIERIYKILEFAAERKGKTGPVSLPIALRRLEHEGWLEVRPGADGGREKVYSLTDSGNEQIGTQLATWTSMFTGFIEDGGLDDSFRKFLDRTL